MLGFIDDNYDITVPGFYANRFRFISLDSRKMILAGYYYGANILDLITIAAFIHISRRRIFLTKFKIADFIKNNKLSFDSSDDFINCIYVYDTFQKFIEKNVNKTEISLDKIRKYCLDNNINFSGLIDVINMRNTIIENMIDIGLDPYFNGLKLSNYTTKDIDIDELTKLKNCIYSGYKCNLLINENTQFYVSKMKGVQIRVSSSIVEGDIIPKFIVVDTYNLSKKFKGEQYEFVTSGFVSNLDNFAIVDPNFSLY